MMDISSEQLIPIGEVPRRLPPRATGKHIHISAVYRWLNRGVRGVVLESVRIGGSTYTTAEALQRFTDRLSAKPAYPPPPTSTTPAWRRKQIEAATKEVEAIVGNGRRRGRVD